MQLSSLEICAGAGGAALGLERAGFQHEALVEIDAAPCLTLARNRTSWRVFEQDLHTFSARPFRGIDLLSGGVPCPPFSHAGQQKGADDERDLFPQALRLVRECRPRAVLLENVRGLADKVFISYRQQILEELDELGYGASWRLLNASDFGVPQLRPRFVLIALQKPLFDRFIWPVPSSVQPPTVGQTLGDLMSANGWAGAQMWSERASTIAPTIVGGSKKHGGPDLGPTRAKAAWAKLGVDGGSIAPDAPLPEFVGMPRLTVRMVARLQGFPDEWLFSGPKTTAYRQVGNAFPPPVAHALGNSVRTALLGPRRASAPRVETVPLQQLVLNHV